MHTTDGDVVQLLGEISLCGTFTEKPNVAGKAKLLKKVVASLQDEDKKGLKVQQQLADIAMGAIS